jgi:predicted Zn finger-like uncharacterized protein
MSLVTACPSCGVLFKVAPEQLLISEGWVRCGQCQTVFDANLSLQPSTKMVLALLQPRGAPLQKSTDLDERVESSIPSVVGPSEPVLAPAQVVAATARQPLIRKFLYVLAPLLVMSLLLQVVLFERNQILSMEPRAKPWLLALCAPFDCRLESLKQIKSIVIDSSTFSKIRPDIYQLSLVMKNTRKVDLLLPSIELTLINSLDQALLRRVFRADELKAQSPTLLASSELPLQFSFAIKSGEVTDRVAGYRLLVFYP